MATNIQLAGKVAKHAQLCSIALRHATIDANFDLDSPPEELQVDLKYRSEIKNSLENIYETKEARIIVEFKFSMEFEDNDEHHVALAIDAAFLLKYKLDKKAQFDETCLQHFAEVNGPYNSWPYWRETVQSIMGRVGLGSYTLPVFHPQAKEIPEDEIK